MTTVVFLIIVNVLPLQFYTFVDLFVNYPRCNTKNKCCFVIKWFWSCFMTYCFQNPLLLCQWINWFSKYWEIFWSTKKRLTKCFQEILYSVLRTPQTLNYTLTVPYIDVCITIHLKIHLTDLCKDWWTLKWEKLGLSRYSIKDLIDWYILQMFYSLGF